MGFVEDIAPIIQKYAPKYNICVVSPIIAQAILESASGTSELAVNACNYFGLKYNMNQPNRCPSAIGYYAKVGSEQNSDGSYTSSRMLWQKFPNMDAGVKGYFDFINNTRYSNLRGITSPQLYLETIKNDGYATSIHYVDNLMTVINNYNLNRFDNVTTTQPQKVADIDVFNAFGHNNMTNYNARQIKYIVIHYTAGTTSKSGTSKNVASYFDKVGTRASADFIVDDGLITQFNGNIENWYCWHCGGNKYNTKGGSLYNIATNKNSIGIEMCSNNITGKVTQANDDNWYFTDATLNNAVKLVKYLMNKYNISINNVIRHYDVTGKPCPAVVGWNEDTGSADKWNEFKRRLDG